jgi:hypothetical protein
MLAVCGFPPGIHVKVDQLTGVYKNMVRGIVTLAFRC